MKIVCLDGYTLNPGDNSWTEQIESTQSRVDDLMISNEQVAVLNEAVGALQPDHKFILRARSELISHQRFVGLLV